MTSARSRSAAICKIEFGKHLAIPPHTAKETSMRTTGYQATFHSSTLTFGSVPRTRLTHIAALFFVLILLGAGALAQTVTTIHDFGSGPDGDNPQSGVVFD